MAGNHTGSTAAYNTYNTYSTRDTYNASHAGSTPIACDEVIRWKAGHLLRPMKAYIVML